MIARWPSRERGTIPTASSSRRGRRGSSFLRLHGFCRAGPLLSTSAQPLTTHAFHSGIGLPRPSPAHRQATAIQENIIIACYHDGASSARFSIRRCPFALKVITGPVYRRPPLIYRRNIGTSDGAHILCKDKRRERKLKSMDRFLGRIVAHVWSRHVFALVAAPKQSAGAVAQGAAIFEARLRSRVRSIIANCIAAMALICGFHIARRASNDEPVALSLLCRHRRRDGTISCRSCTSFYQHHHQRYLILRIRNKYLRHICRHRRAINFIACLGGACCAILKYEPNASTLTLATECHRRSQHHTSHCEDASSWLLPAGERSRQLRRLRENVRSRVMTASGRRH